MSADRTDLTDRDRRLVLDILAAHLPPGSDVWVFGSRATGRARPLSDLDLAVDAGRPLTLDETAILREALSDSDLPFLVDIVDWHAIDARFRKSIAAERLSL
ncbi:MAG: nucleotidyltransferase family protein [Stellaceae bacterium]